MQNYVHSFLLLCDSIQAIEALGHFLNKGRRNHPSRTHYIERKIEEFLQVMEEKGIPPPERTIELVPDTWQAIRFLSKAKMITNASNSSTKLKIPLDEQNGSHSSNLGETLMQVQFQGLDANCRYTSSCKLVF
ncbi:pentatricopeptide repeat-containing protein-like protein [Salvia divinorum]|uniref:Pentatricopeptide repeat-containing protein-like protein n=1 Tax=Salvia divinorum TaxID=28513 RepID=A0ABD1GYI0_SALDI